MKLSTLKPNEQNPRTITDEKLFQLKKALKEFGPLDGFVYNRKTEQLVSGHQRQKLFAESEITITKKYPKPSKTGTTKEGYVTIDGERFSFREVYWDLNKEKAANIAANKGAGDWDMPQLAEWMKELNSFDADFDTGLTMFSEEEMKQFEGITVKEHTRVGATGVDEDEVPEKAPARSKLGDMYQLGNHRLMCGDSTKEESVKRLMQGKKADMVFTDPPYGMNLNVDYDQMFQASDSSHKKTGKRFKKVEGDDVDFNPECILRIEAKECYIWGADYFYDKLPKGGSWVAWDKRDENLDRVPGNTTEFLWSKNPHRRMSLRVKWSGHHGMQKEDVKTRVHPTQKPVALIEKFFEELGSKHQIILDLFGGSGSTLIACEKTHRTCFMMELDPHYCDVIVERWEKYTGHKAKKITPVHTSTKKAVKPLRSRNEENSSPS